MIDERELVSIRTRAYIPEHLPWYVRAVSGGEPYLLGDYLVYQQGSLLVFIGYPLRGDFENCAPEDKGLINALEACIEKFKPATVSLISPRPPGDLTGWEPCESDDYYCLDLRGLHLQKKVRNMLRRAGREVMTVRGKRFSREHRRLVDGFLRFHRVDESTRSIFNRLGSYIRSGHAHLLEARDKNGRLTAFDVVDFGAQDYACYMFNFTSEERYVPGASDLLLYRLIEEAISRGKRKVNLGLGINSGVAFFKRKWGGERFLPYTHWLWESGKSSPFADDLLDALIR